MSVHGFASHRTSVLATALGISGALLLSGCSWHGSASAGHDGAAHSTPAAAPATAGAAPGAVTSAATVLPQEFASSNGRLDVTLTAAETQVPYRGGTRWAMTYNGTATGPTLRVRPGDVLNVTLVNNLGEMTSLHTHGLHVSPEGSGDNPFVTVAPGASRTYTYAIPADQPAGTFWYHPHAHGVVAEQVHAGLSGAIIVENGVDDTLARTTTDRVLVVNDPPLVTANPGSGTDGQAMGMGGMGMGGTDMGGMDGHAMDGHSMDMGGTSMGSADMMTAMLGRTGPRLLTNGQDGVTLTGSAGLLERAHVVNATASTRLVLTWTGARMIRLAAEGSRLPSPEQVDSIELAPGERTEVVLVPGPSGGALRAQRLSNEAGGDPVGLPEVLATVEPSTGTDTSTIPSTLTAGARDLFAAGVPVAERRVVRLDRHMNPTIDGRLFDPSVVTITARRGTVEEWVIRNNTPMYHPIHLHTWAFQVAGEAGWQDVVTVAPHSEQVIRIAFDDFSGTTVFHCHVLDHEDTGMMAVMKVV